MKTLVLEQPGKIVLQDSPYPQTPAQHEALVHILRLGICGTDLHAYEGTQPFFSYPRILGHELAVKVLAVDPASFVKVGDICAVEPYYNCGACISCRRGKPNACVQLSVLGVHQDGGMREQIIVPIHKLHPANNLSLNEIAMVEMLCIGAHAVRRAELQAGENVVVIGTGPIGLGTICFAQLANANVIAVDINPARLAFCRDVLGVQQVLNAADNPIEQIQSMLGGDMPTAVFDATGNRTSMMNAFQYVAHGGKLVYVGLVQGDLSFNDPYFHSHEISLLASRNATPDDFRFVIAALADGRVKLDGWVTHQATPESLPTDFPTWLDPATGVIKAVLAF
jgi:2-desacetyl-2-hydroxyethyl bacteriochlorophyllide A dehydrogenase